MVVHGGGGGDGGGCTGGCCPCSTGTYTGAAYCNLYCVVVVHGGGGGGGSGGGGDSCLPTMGAATLHALVGIYILYI